jgi:hypothetical protein
MRSPDPHVRDAAAVQLAGYLLSMIRFGEIPSPHSEEVIRLVAAVRRTQGTDEQVSA